MAKNDDNLLNWTLDQVMSDRFGRYSKYIIQDRALPDSRDGLKPVQRRILYSMNDLGLTYNKAFKKSARVVGDVIGKYHPHGDSSIYEAMVRMSQDWKMNMPLIEMHGNNGSIDNDPAAAMRYTEARLAKITKTLIDNIKKETVKFAPNFDDSEKEPTVFPALLPNLLVNGAKGIAAGYATEIPPHNLKEVIQTIIAKIKKPEITLNGLLKHISGPDFPTGGIIQGKNGIYEAFERGRGKIVIRSKYEINKAKKNPTIVISEIPYGVIKAKLVRDIDEIRFNNKIARIKTIRDESDRRGISIFIELEQGANVNAVLNYLLAKTELQIYYNYNMIAIKDKVPTLMGLMDVVDAYLKHQEVVQIKALKFDLNKHTIRLEIIEGLIKVGQLADAIINSIKKVRGSKAEVIKMLMVDYQFTNLQAIAIAELRLYRLSQTDQSIYLTEKESLITEIARITELLNDKAKFDAYLIAQLKELAKEYGQERKAMVEDADLIENISIDMEDLIKHEDLWIGLSHEGYLKSFSNKAYEANELSAYGLKEGDSLKYLTYLNTAHKLLVFTNLGKYIFVPCHLIVNTKFQDIGKHINDFATLAPNEHIVSVIAVEDFKLNCFITQVTKQGKAKMTKVADFEVSRFKKTYKSFNLKAGDEVMGAKITNGHQQIVIINSEGKAVRYGTNDISLQGTGAAGARCMNLSSGHVIKDFAIVDNNSVLGLISQRGGMKRIKVQNIKPASKGTQGLLAFRPIKGNQHIPIAMEVVHPETKVIFFTKKLHIFSFNEVIITTPLESMSLIGPAQPQSGTIMLFPRVYQDNPILMKRHNISTEERFEQAIKTVDDMKQISIDDILDKLK